MADQNLGIETEIIRAFAQESRGLIEQLEPSLNELEKNRDLQTINYIYRFFHSIKGGASFMGLSNIARATNAVENMLDQLRSGKILLQIPKHVDLLSHACDFLKEALDRLEKQPNDNDLESQAETIVSEFRDVADKPIKILKASRSLKKGQQFRKTFIVGVGQGVFLRSFHIFKR